MQSRFFLHYLIVKGAVIGRRRDRMAQLLTLNAESPIAQLCRQNKVPVRTVTARALMDLQPFNQGDLLQCSRRTVQRALFLEDSAVRLSPSEVAPLKYQALGARTWLAIDQVVDPMNLGSLLRTSYFLGVAGVVMTDTQTGILSSLTFSQPRCRP